MLSSPCGRRLLHVAAFCGQIAFLPTVGAQATLSGVVLKEPGRQPAAGAEVTVEALGRMTRTDSAGRYSVTGLSRGLRLVRVRLLGYTPASFTLAFSEGQKATHDVLLALAGVRLDSVRSVGQRVRFGTFDDNRRAGLGRFFTQDEIQRMHAVSLSQVLASLPSVKIGTGTGTRAWVTSTRPGGVIIRPERYSTRRGAVPACYANVYVDGEQVYHGRDEEPLFDVGELSVDQIGAIEYYNEPGEAPAEYRSQNMNCGALVIWRRK